MSQGLKAVVIKAPTFTADRPTAVPSLADAYQSGQVSDQQLSQVEQFSIGNNLKNQMWQLPPQQAMDVYHQLSPAQQEALRFAGYKLPGTPVSTEQTEEGGWSGNWLSDALHIADNTAGAVIGGGGAVVGAVGEGLSWGNDQLKAAYRQSTTYDWNEGAGALSYMTPAPVLGGLFDNWTHDNASEDGNTFYNTERLTEAEQQIGNDTVFFYAKQVAEGKSIDTMFEDLQGDEDAIAGLIALSESQQFTDAVELIGGSHVSPGRDFASALGLEGDSDSFNRISGFGDAAYTVLADPLLMVGPIGKSVQAAKYGITDVGKAGQLFSNKNVSRYMDGFMGHYASLADDTASVAAKGEALGKIRTQYKTFAPMLDELGAAGVKTTDDLRDYLVSQEGFVRLLQGKAALKVPLMPYRTAMGQRARDLAARANPLTAMEARAYKNAPDATMFLDDALAGTDEAKATIEAMIKSRHSIFGRMSTFMTRPTQKVPFGRRLDFKADDAQENVYRLARFVMPKYWADQTSAAFVGANTEGKRTIMRGLFESMGEISGVSTTAAGKKEWGRLMGDAFGDPGAVHAYAQKISTVADDGVTKVLKEPDLMPNGDRVAVGAWQMREYVEIPDFKEMYRLMTQLPMMEAATRGGGAGNKIGAMLTSGPLDKFTEQFWKPGVLLRPALPIRNGMEEVTNFIMRHSTKEFGKGIVGTWALRGSADAAKAKVLAKSLGDDGQKALASGNYVDVFVAWEAKKLAEGATGRTASKARLANVRKRKLKADTAFKILSDDDTMYLREFMQEGGWRNVVADMDDFTDAQKGIMGVKSNIAKPTKTTLAGKKGTVEPLSGTPYEVIGTASDKEATQWATYATSWAHSPDGRIVLENLGNRDEAITRLVAWVDGEGSWMHKQSDMVAELGSAEWANRVYDTVHGTFTGRGGEVFDDMVRQALDDGVVDPVHIIDNIAVDSRPEWTVGQDFILGKDAGTLGSAYHKVIDKGFDVSEEVTQRFSRYPTFTPQYLRHRKNMAAFEAELVPKVGKTAARKIAHRNSYDAAMRDMLEYVDNPAIRSQAAVALRNVFPFWRAQEEFFVRWAKTGIFNPYAFRKLQLTYQGFQEVGTIHKDKNGDDVFNYPLLGEAAQSVSKALAAVGVGSYVPVPIATSAKVQYLNQGLDPNNILPSFGPGPSFVLGSIRSIYPNTANIERLLLGDLGAGRNPVMNLLPTPIRRVLDSDEWKASSTLSAAAYLEYAGQSPPPDATPGELQEYKEKLQNWSVGLSVLRAAFGSFTPASPTFEVAPPETAAAWREWGMNNVDDEFWSIVSKTDDYGAAIAAWMRIHPETLPFTVSKSETPSGAIVGSTKETGDFVTKNATFFEKYSSAAPFWLAGVDGGDFDPETWQLLGSMGIKEAKTFEDFYGDLKASPKISEYYDARDAHEQYQKEQLAAGADSAVLDNETAQYNAWREMFLAQNPLVTDYLAAGGARQQERENTLREMETALLDPNVPQTESTNRIADMLAAYRSHQGWQAQQVGTAQAVLDAKSAEKEQYMAYMTSASEGDPAAQMVWNMLLRWAG